MDGKGARKLFYARAGGDTEKEKAPGSGGEAGQGGRGKLNYIFRLS